MYILTVEINKSRTALETHIRNIDDTDKLNEYYRYLDCHCIDMVTINVNGHACKERRRLYLLLEGETFPMILSLPTGSLKDFSRYLMRVLPKYERSNAVLTKFSLVKTTNKGGIVYTKVSFHMERKLTAAETSAIEPISERAKAISKTMGFEIETDDDAAKEKVECHNNCRAVA